MTTAAAHAPTVEERRRLERMMRRECFDAIAGTDGRAVYDGWGGIEVARTTVTQAEVDAVWQTIADRGYDCSDLREVLAEYASDMLASVQTAEEAVRAAERAFGVAPGSSWCAECREGGVEADWNSERCELCGGWLEVT